MSKNNALTKSAESLDIISDEEGNNLLSDVAIEMKKKLDLVNEIIELLHKDTRVEDVIDAEDNKIGQKSHLHPQLLSWIKEARNFYNDLWKLNGGEIKQEGQKKSIELMAKIILEGVNQNPEILQEKFKEWTENRSFKNEKKD